MAEWLGVAVLYNLSPVVSVAVRPVGCSCRPLPPAWVVYVYAYTYTYTLSYPRTYGVSISIPMLGMGMDTHHMHAYSMHVHLHKHMHGFNINVMVHSHRILTYPLISLDLVTIYAYYLCMLVIAGTLRPLLFRQYMIYNILDISYIIYCWLNKGFITSIFKFNLHQFKSLSTYI